MTPLEFNEKAESLYRKYFPVAYVATNTEGALGPFISMRFGVQDPKFHTNGYAINDPGRIHLTIFRHVDEDGNMKDKISVEGSNACLFIKPSEYSHMAYGSRKFGYRKITASPEKALERLDKFFAKVRKIVDEEREAGNLAHNNVG